MQLIKQSNLLRNIARICLLAAVMQIEGGTFSALAADGPSYLLKRRHYKLGHERLYVNSHSLRIELLERGFFFTANAPDWRVFAVSIGSRIYHEEGINLRSITWAGYDRLAKAPENCTYHGMAAIKRQLSPHSPDRGESVDEPPYRPRFPPHGTDEQIIITTDVLRENCLHLPKGPCDAVNKLMDLPLDPGLPLCVSHHLANGTIGIETETSGYEKLPSSSFSFFIPKGYRQIKDRNEFFHQAIRSETEDMFQELKIGDPFGSEKGEKKVPPTSK